MKKWFKVSTQKDKRELSETLILQAFSFTSSSKVKRITNLSGNKERCPPGTPFVLLLSGSPVQAIPKLRTYVQLRKYHSKLLLPPSQSFSDKHIMQNPSNQAG